MLGSLKETRGKKSIKEKTYASSRYAKRFDQSDTFHDITIEYINISVHHTNFSFFSSKISYIDFQPVRTNGNTYSNADFKSMYFCKWFYI